MPACDQQAGVLKILLFGEPYVISVSHCRGSCPGGKTIGNQIQKLLGAVLITSLMSVVTTASANATAAYHVTITNITCGINFTPNLMASHRRKLPLFELGSDADSDITAVAEGGDTSGPAASAKTIFAPRN